jgi:predicted RNA binding protein YcfA (HicA-like mRNA interferase family)
MSHNFGADKDTEKLIRAARKQGWEVRLTKGNHIQFLPPNSREIVVASLTGSIRSQRHLRHNLSRAGMAL